MIELPIDGELSVRQAALGDAEDLFALVDRNRDYLGRWLPWPGAIATVDDERAFLRMAAGQWEARAEFVGLVVLSGRLIGAVTLHDLDLGAKKAAIGYWLDEGCQGQGYATRAVQAMQEFAFGLGCTRLEILVDVGNARSRALAERLGYRLAEIRPQAMVTGVDAEVDDEAVYVLDAAPV